MYATGWAVHLVLYDISHIVIPHNNIYLKQLETQLVKVLFFILIYCNVSTQRANAKNDTTKPQLCFIWDI